MFFCRAIIEKSLEHLRDIHPLVLFTFLAYKEIDLPIGTLKDTRGVERSFLEKYFRPAPEYEGFYRPSRLSDKSKAWLNKKYPDAGLQSLRTRSANMERVLLHDRGGGYGWRRDYVSGLQSLLKSKPLPGFHIAIWLYRGVDWPKSTTPQGIIDKFRNQFKITQDEERLFDLSVPTVAGESMFCSEPIEWIELKQVIGNYPNAPLEEGGLLKSLSLEGVGPIDGLVFEPGERLNIVAGDNGLGKTFLLDCAWWAMSQNWAGKPVHPRVGARWASPRILYEIGTSDELEKMTAKYDWNLARWTVEKKRSILPGLLIYARIDNSFAIWDPAKFILYNSVRQNGEKLSLNRDFQYANPSEFQKGQLLLNDEEVWNGKRIQTESREERVLCNGFNQDLMTWSGERKSEAVAFFSSALERLSPPGFKLTVGKPIRIPPDVRDILTIRHPYGDVPVVDISAGIRRVLGLLYLITWAWAEHKAISQQIKKAPQRRVIVLIDEMESHLHPKWQRTIVPTLMETIKELSPSLEIQYIISTHSPLILASTEPYFNDSTDKLFHLDLLTDKVELNETPYVKFGKVDNWLQASIFGLKQARSKEAEEAIERAKEIQLMDSPDPRAVRAIHADLEKHLSSSDEFWPRWMYFGRKYGV